MASQSPKPYYLGDSWVVEEDEDEDEDDSFGNSTQDEEEQAPAPLTPPRRSLRNNRSPEPELVMPSLSMESMNGSWGQTSGRHTRPQWAQPAERGIESRRRTSHSGIDARNYETRPKTKTSTTHKAIPSIRDSRWRSKSALDIALEIMFWLLDIVAGALRVLKKPLSYFLAIWLLFGVFVIARNLVTRSVYASLSPLCRLPGASLLDLPFCSGQIVEPQEGSPPPAEFEQLMTVQAKFEEVLEENSGAIDLPYVMKRSEASIRDLRQLIIPSSLHSKDELLLELDGFIKTSGIASNALLSFNSHVIRAVDSVISTTRWTTRVLDGIEEREASSGAINAFINKLLAPFQPVKFTEKILRDQYIQHTRFVEEEIHKLVAEAQGILEVLTNLEDRLELIHGISIRDDMHTMALKEDILAELWTMVGGNRGKLNELTGRLDLLKQVQFQRKNAYRYVSKIIIRVQAIAVGLEDLRERVMSPELRHGRGDVPLSVYLEIIQQGLERLEANRQAAGQLKNEHLQRVFTGDQSGARMIDG